MKKQETKKKGKIAENEQEGSPQNLFLFPTLYVSGRKLLPIIPHFRGVCPNC